MPRIRIEPSITGGAGEIKAGSPPAGRCNEGRQRTPESRSVLARGKSRFGVSSLAKGVLRFLRSGCDAFAIAGCRADVLAPGAEHGTHANPDKLPGSVHFPGAHAGADTIDFHDPRARTVILRPPVVELTAEAADQRVVSARNRSLPVFPACLQQRRTSAGATRSASAAASTSCPAISQRTPARRVGSGDSDFCHPACPDRFRRQATSISWA